MSSRLLLPFVLIAVVALVFAACNDDNGSSDGGDERQPAAMDDTGSDDAADDAADDASDDTGGDTGGASGVSTGGTATLTIGGETFEFDDYYCAFGPEATQNDRVSFSSGSTTQGLDVSIQDTEEQGRYEGEGTIHSITYGDWANTGSVTLSNDAAIMIDGKNITADTTFDDSSTDLEIEEVPGTFEGHCS